MLETLVNSTARVKGKVTLPHPEESLRIMEKLGKIAHIKVSAPVEGEGDITILNSFIIETRIDDDENYGTVGLYINQAANKFTVYSGLTASMCLNLSIFGADYVHEQKKINLSVMQGLLNNSLDVLPKQLKHIQQMKEKLSERVYNESQWNERFGELLLLGEKSLYPNLLKAVEAQSLEIYADMPNSDWKLLSLLTDSVKNESPANRVSKTQLIESLI